MGQRSQAMRELPPERQAASPLPSRAERWPTPGALKSLQRCEQRSGIDLEDPARYLLDAAGNAKAVHGFKAECLEDEHVKRALDDIRVQLIHKKQ
jgi:hypothetical protein